jgi:sugar lactone lactonase YvrE
MIRRTAAFAVLAVVAAASLRATGPQFWRLEGAPAFLGGEIEGLSLDSDGRLRLGPDSKRLFDPEAPNAWCVARDGRGVLYVGTGNDGRVLRVDGDEGSVLFDAEELEVYALAAGPDGRIYAGSSPDGAVYAIDAAGQATRFFDPAEKYIWALAFDAKGALYVATGGEGHVYRVTPDGKSETLLTTTETHVLSLAVDERGRVFAGSAPEGIVYRIDAPGKAFVLVDSGFREIKALALGPDGSLYAAAIDGQTAEAARPAPAAATPAPTATSGGVVAEVTVSESYSVVAPAPPVATGAETAPGPPKGALLRIDASGDVDTLWSSTEDVPYAAVRSGAGVLVGTGNKGKVYRVGDDARWALVASLPAQQVTALAPAPAGGATLVTSNPARLFSIGTRTAKQGTFVSKVKDTEAVSTWGRVSWEGTAPPGSEVRLQTRAGNTATPDATWTDWSAPSARPGGEPTGTGKARFLQVRVTVVAGQNDSSPTVEAVAAAYLQRNLSPVVRAITVHPAGDGFQKPISVSGEPEILGLVVDPLSERAASQRAPAGSPPAISFSRKLYQRGLRTFSWQADDPNGDPLLYTVEYRSVGDERWRRLQADLEEPVFAWETGSVPNGRYVVRVLASDAPGNPPDLALSGSKDSASFLIDNAPPSIAASLDRKAPARIRVVVRDDASPVRRLELSIDAGRWEEVHPRDGIADSLEETFEIPLRAALSGQVVVLRATDLLGNVATARVDVP